MAYAATGVRAIKCGRPILFSAAQRSSEVHVITGAATGADAVIVTAPGIVRFSEASGQAGTRDNSHPARFVHIDATAATSALFAARTIPAGRSVRRYAHYNVWRAFSGAPQDVSLALCDMTSVDACDRFEADAIFDPPSPVAWKGTPVRNCAGTPAVDAA